VLASDRDACDILIDRHRDGAVRLAMHISVALSGWTQGRPRMRGRRRVRWATSPGVFGVRRPARASTVAKEARRGPADARLKLPDAARP
jgi:hypothetical protein